MDFVHSHAPLSWEATTPVTLLAGKVVKRFVFFSLHSQLHTIETAPTTANNTVNMVTATKTKLKIMSSLSSSFIATPILLQQHRARETTP
jgi:hypothetical protein